MNATHQDEARRNRPPVLGLPSTIAELKERNRENGGCWFDRGSMNFFGTRIESGIIARRYFITSEQPPHGSRAFSVRTFDEKGDVQTVGPFCDLPTKEAARALIAQTVKA